MNEQELYELSKNYYKIKDYSNLDVVRLRKIFNVNFQRDTTPKTIIDQFGSHKTISAQEYYAELRAHGVEPYIYEDKQNGILIIIQLRNGETSYTYQEGLMEQSEIREYERSLNKGKSSWFW